MQANQSDSVSDDEQFSNVKGKDLFKKMKTKTYGEEDENI